MKVHYLAIGILSLMLALFSALQALAPEPPPRESGARFVCESTDVNATCENRYGKPAGTYGAIMTAYRGDKRYVDVKNTAH